MTRGLSTRLTDGLQWYDHQAQVRVVADSIHDPTPALPTGMHGLDSLLRRGGLLPGTLTVLGGRTGTRKTTVALNWLLDMATNGIPVGFVGLDERPWMYSLKFMALRAGVSNDWLEEHWDDPAGEQVHREWKAFAKDRVHVFGGRRPTLDHLSGMLDIANMGTSQAPRIMVVDYLALMTRDKKYGWNDSERLMRLTEEMTVWANDANVALVVLHQLSRNDEYGGSNNRNNGENPGTLTQLKYAGEDPADYVFFTYRPALNPLGNMTMPVARQVLGDRFDEDEYWDLAGYCKKMARSTFVQLLKNRPGTKKEERGLELLSPDDSLRLVEKAEKEEEETRDHAEAARRH